MGVRDDGEEGIRYVDMTMSCWSTLMRVQCGLRHGRMDGWMDGNNDWDQGVEREQTARGYLLACVDTYDD